MAAPFPLSAYEERGHAPFHSPHRVHHNVPFDREGVSMSRTRVSSSCLAVLIGVASAFPAAGETPCRVVPAVLGTTAKTSEVSTEEIVKLLEDGRTLVLDARPHLEFSVSHIPGARNVAAKPGVPAAKYVSDVAEIDRLVAG